MEEGGVEEHRKDGESLLLKESRTLLGVASIVSVLRPVTLSLDVHWDDVSELSVAVTQHRDMLNQQFDYYCCTNITELHNRVSGSSLSAQLICHCYLGYGTFKVALSRICNAETLATPSGRSREDGSNKQIQILEYDKLTLIKRFFCWGLKQENVKSRKNTYRWRAGSRCPAPARLPLCSRRATGRRRGRRPVDASVGERVKSKDEG